ncbi:MAG TPA: response regulator transcription factor [Corynebacterium sp.]|uniref:response regulator transcription factor n=1 Tax=Corynebacterium sp. TaxID=1720 RepID=UPI0018244230|nr:response regulator transcription factor [Corynebacterium sp.]HHT32034.1 response regulator transcription factor [Corynebacterium sp.]
MDPENTRIIVVEDQELLLDALAHSLSAEEDMKVVARLRCALDVDDEVARLHPDLVLMDVCTLHGASGIDACRRLHAAHPDLPIVLMTAMPDITFLEEAKKVGAMAFVYKDMPTDELVTVLRQARRGYSTFPEERRMPVLGYNNVTPREIEVLQFVCAGLSRREIADEMHLSENTIKAVIRSLLTKTGFATIARLAIYAVAHGFVVVDGDGVTVRGPGTVEA